MGGKLHFTWRTHTLAVRCQQNTGTLYLAQMINLRIHHARRVSTRYRYSRVWCNTPWELHVFRACLVSTKCRCRLYLVWHRTTIRTICSYFRLPCVNSKPILYARCKESWNLWLSSAVVCQPNTGTLYCMHCTWHNSSCDLWSFSPAVCQLKTSTLTHHIWYN